MIIMSVQNVRHGVMRAQGDKLCVMMGLKPGTNIPRNVFDMITETQIGEKIVVFGDTPIVVTASMKALVSILTGKNVLEE